MLSNYSALASPADFVILSLRRSKLLHVTRRRSCSAECLLDSRRGRAGLAARFGTLHPVAGLARSCRCPAEVVAAERARVAIEGWGARLLALQGEDGQWDGGALFPARRGESAGGDPSDQNRVTHRITVAAGVPALDCHGVQSRAAARPRGRPSLRPGAPSRGASQRPLPLGARRAAVFRRRGRTLYQRSDHRSGCLLRSKCR